MIRRAFDFFRQGTLSQEILLEVLVEIWISGFDVEQTAKHLVGSLDDADIGLEGIA